MKGNSKEIKFYITHSIELLFWLIIVLFIVAVFSFINIKNKQTDNDYTIYMNDVDGLIVGSPVRMMGIDVGHVTKIQPAEGEMYVKFILKDNSLELPQGTIATVEFSGMAGSKSLELYLPDKNTYLDKNIPLITVAPPKRLHDALGLLNDMFDKIGSIMNTSSAFSKKFQTIDMPTENNQNVSELIDYANNMIDISTKKAVDLGEAVEKYKGNKK